MTNSTSRAGPGRNAILALIILVAVGAAVVAVWRGSARRGGSDRGGRSALVAPVDPTQTPPPPPQRYASAFLNTNANTEYAGEQSCDLCHEEIVRSYRKHGMARTFTPVSPERMRGDWRDRNSVHHEASNYTYTMEERDGRYFMIETRPDAAGKSTHRVEKEIDYLIGSGDTDLGFVYEEAGRYYVLPVEWYTKERRWDVAPGFEGPQQERWKRKLLPGCLGCHATLPDYIDQSGNRYGKPLPIGIGCESCHGPGALHADARMGGRTGLGADGVDSTIVNPRRLPPARQLDVCAQCHLQGDVRRPRPGCGQFDFRPGLRLDDFRLTYVPTEEDTLAFGFVRHVERMVRSRCFLESGTMTCTTCHNPHESSRGRTASHWAQKCLSCHSDGDCPVSADDPRMGEDCVSCHMRRSEPYDLLHVAITDHWIRREVEPPSSYEITRNRAVHETLVAPFASDGSPGKLLPTEFVELGMSHVAVGLYELGASLIQRGRELTDDRSEALLQLAIAFNQTGRTEEGVGALYEAAALGPESAEAAFRLGQTALAARQMGLAAGAFRVGLAAYPDDAQAWAGLGIALAELDSLDEALEAARRAVEIHPQLDTPQRVLGTVLAALGRYDEAAPPTRAALSLSPDDTDAWLTLGSIEANAGRREAALSAWDEAARRLPPQANPWEPIAQRARAGDRVLEAVLALQARTRQAPDDLDAWLAFGDILGRTGRFEEAAGAFERALAVDRNSIAAWGNMALAYTEMGETGTARAMLDSVLARYPGNSQAMALLARIAQIEQLRAAGDTLTESSGRR